MTDTIKNIIDKFELGYVFTIGDFSLTAENPKAVGKTMNRTVIHCVFTVALLDFLISRKFTLTFLMQKKITF